MTNTQVAAQGAQVNQTFHDWSQAGFGTELLPIIPPGAPLTVGTSLDPSDIGKVPGKLHGKRWSGFAGWANHRATLNDHNAWTLWQSRSGAGIGLQSRKFPGVDIDVTDQALSDAILLAADLKLGDAPERVGRAPKRLLVYRIADGEVIRKKRVDFTAPDGSAHAVEVLGAGQQYIVEGTHPGTGRPYAWTSGRTPETIGAANLTTVTAAQVDAFLDEVENLVTAAGGTVAKRSGGTGTALVAVSAPPQAGLLGNPASIADALAAMGNELSYPDWIEMCAAIKAALGGAEALYPIFEDWCLLYPQNTPAVARAKWDSLKPPYSIGASYVFDKARVAGWAGYGAAYGLVDESGTSGAGSGALPPSGSAQPSAPLDLTHDGMALAFANANKDTLRFDHSAARWYRWGGSIWVRDERKLTFNAVRRMCRAAAAQGKKSDGFTLKSGGFMETVERLARSDSRLSITADQWDADPWVAGTPDGLLDLKTCKLLPSDPSRLISKMLGAVPDMSATPYCPVWENFLDDVTGGSADFKRGLQQIAGYALTGDTRAQLLFFVYGEGGTGKSTFLRTIASALGTYARAANMTTFTARKHDMHLSELAALAGARLVTASETESGRKWAEAKIKELTGGDPITANFMRQDPFTFKPVFKLIMAGNHAPALDNVDSAMKRRLWVVPFDRRPSVVDTHLDAKLEAELPGILGWMLAGLADYLANGFVMPQAVKTATDSYFNDEDVIGSWLTDRCDKDPTARTSTADLHASYTSYCSAQGKIGHSAQALKVELLRRGLLDATFWVTIDGKSVQRRGVEGLALKP